MNTQLNLNNHIPATQLNVVNHYPNVHYVNSKTSLPTTNHNKLSALNGKQQIIGAEYGMPINYAIPQQKQVISNVNPNSHLKTNSKNSSLGVKNYNLLVQGVIPQYVNQSAYNKQIQQIPQTVLNQPYSLSSNRNIGLNQNLPLNSKYNKGQNIAVLPNDKAANTHLNVLNVHNTQLNSYHNVPKELNNVPNAQQMLNKVSNAQNLHTQLNNVPNYPSQLNNVTAMDSINTASTASPPVKSLLEQPTPQQSTPSKIGPIQRSSIGTANLWEELKPRMGNHNVLSNPGQNEQGVSKECQDTYFIMNSINNFPEFNVYAVLDGHGPNGKAASNIVSNFMQKSIRESQGLKLCQNYENIIEYLKRNGHQFIKEIYKNSEEYLKPTGLDFNFSGTTCVMVFQVMSKLICSNCGDSRAVLMKKMIENNDHKTKLIDLSVDHKPNIPEENLRINIMGGEVRQLGDICRVFVRGKNYPGIAMSRSIGDFVASSIGVMPYPDFKEITLDDNSLILTICCDGIWDRIDYNTMLDLGSKYYIKNNPKAFSIDLLNKAVKLWGDISKYVDDITIVTVFFNK